MWGRLYAELVVDAPDRAIRNRRPAEGLSHHRDYHSQCQRSAEALPYTSLAFGKRLEQQGILSSMGAGGDALDTAVAESFFSTLQAERLDKQSWAKRAKLPLAIVEYSKVYSNRQRLHSTLGYLAPTELEADWQERQSSLRGDELLSVH